MLLSKIRGLHELSAQLLRLYCSDSRLLQPSQVPQSQPPSELRAWTQKLRAQPTDSPPKPLDILIQQSSRTQELIRKCFQAYLQPKGCNLKLRVCDRKWAWPQQFVRRESATFRLQKPLSNSWMSSYAPVICTYVGKMEPFQSMSLHFHKPSQELIRPACIHSDSCMQLSHWDSRSAQLHTHSQEKVEKDTVILYKLQCEKLLGLVGEKHQLKSVEIRRELTPIRFNVIHMYISNFFRWHAIWWFF